MPIWRQNATGVSKISFKIAKVCLGPRLRNPWQASGEKGLKPMKEAVLGNGNWSNIYWWEKRSGRDISQLVSHPGTSFHAQSLLLYNEWESERSVPDPGLPRYQGADGNTPSCRDWFTGHFIFKISFPFLCKNCNRESNLSVAKSGLQMPDLTRFLLRKENTKPKRISYLC